MEVSVRRARPFSWYCLIPGTLRQGGLRLVASGDRVFLLVGCCDIPFTARALSVNVTVTQPTAPGNLRLYPAGTPLPMASSIKSKRPRRALGLIAAPPSNPRIGLQQPARISIGSYCQVLWIGPA